jgi:hypothetical protein
VNQFKPERSAGKNNPSRYGSYYKSTSFSAGFKVLGIPQKQLEFLNPQYRFSIVPVKGKYSKLAVPDGYWDDFVLWQDSVYNALIRHFFSLQRKKLNIRRHLAAIFG